MWFAPGDAATCFGSVTAQDFRPEALVVIRIVFTVALFVAAASDALADPITMTASRTIVGSVAFTDTSGLGSRESDGAGSTTAGAFRASRTVTTQTELGFLSVAVSQDTTFDALAHRIIGSGSISAGPNSTEGIGEVDKSLAFSEVFLDFTLARPMPFRFRGAIAGADGALVQANIEGPGGRPFDESAFSGPVRFDDRGILQPGSYLFAARATLGEGIPSITGAASFDIDFSVGPAATPEPASLALLASGLVAAIASRRRITTRSPDDEPLRLD